MVTTIIHRVGSSYRVKFSSDSLRGTLLEGFFSAEELEELRMAVDQAREQVRQLRSELPSDPQPIRDILTQYQEQFKKMSAASKSNAGQDDLDTVAGVPLQHNGVDVTQKID